MEAVGISLGSILNIQCGNCPLVSRTEEIRVKPPHRSLGKQLIEALIGEVFRDAVIIFFQSIVQNSFVGKKLRIVLKICHQFIISSVAVNRKEFRQKTICHLLIFGIAVLKRASRKRCGTQANT